MPCPIEKIIAELAERGHAVEDKHTFCMVVPYSETTLGHTRYYVAYVRVDANCIKQAQARASNQVWDSLFSAKLRGDVFAATIDKKVIRKATSAERKRYFS